MIDNEDDAATDFDAADDWAEDVPEAADEPAAKAGKRAGRTMGTATEVPPLAAGSAFLSYCLSERMADWLLLYVGQNPLPFARTFQRMRTLHQTFILSWSLPAFLFGFAWFFYRRMWLMGLVFLLVPGFMVQYAPQTAPVVLLVPPFIAGFLGKGFYLNAAFRQIHRIDLMAQSDEAKAGLIRSAGGVSVLGAVIGTLMYVSSIGAGLLAMAGLLGQLHMLDMMTMMQHMHPPTEIRF